MLSKDYRLRMRHDIRDLIRQGADVWGTLLKVGVRFVVFRLPFR